MSDTMLLVKSLGYSYSDQFELKDINLEVKKGEIHGFLGPNGAGKSTTIKLISSLISLETGSIKVDGDYLSEKQDVIKSKIGVLLENAPLFMDMKVREYLKFIAKLHRVPSNVRNEYIDDCLKKMNLTHVQDRIIKNLSKGYKQRVGVAQAIVHRPKLVILDEPTLGLDPQSIKDMRQLILSLRGEYTFLICSHLLSEVELTCDRVSIINRGKLLFSGSIDDFKHTKNTSKLLVLKVNELSKAKDYLLNLPFISSIENEQDHLLVSFSGGDEEKIQIGNICFENNFGLIELFERNLSLEDLFLDKIGESDV
jgi:ABC-2 type transport system ATP-binding protein